jgi:hypothetical protein
LIVSAIDPLALERRSTMLGYHWRESVAEGLLEFHTRTET